MVIELLNNFRVEWGGVGGGVGELATPHPTEWLEQWRNVAQSAEECLDRRCAAEACAEVTNGRKRWG